MLGRKYTDVVNQPESAAKHYGAIYSLSLSAIAIYLRFICFFKKCIGHAEHKRGIRKTNLIKTQSNQIKGIKGMRRNKCSQTNTTHSTSPNLVLLGNYSSSHQGPYNLINTSCSVRTLAISPSLWNASNSMLAFNAFLDQGCQLG